MDAPRNPYGSGTTARLVIRKVHDAVDGAPGSAPSTVGLDNNEVGRRKLQICAQLRILNRRDFSGAIGVIGQDAAIGIVDDAVVGVMGDAPRTPVKCTQGESAFAPHALEDEVVQQDRVVDDIEVLDPVDIAVSKRRREAECILSRAAGERVGRQTAVQQIAASAANERVGSRNTRLGRLRGELDRSFNSYVEPAGTASAQPSPGAVGDQLPSSM